MSNEKDSNDSAAPDDQADSEELIETTVLPSDESVAEAERTPEEALADAEARSDEHWNKYLRVVAELDNVRKRNARDLEKARNYGVEGLAGELLSVADSLEMGLEAADTATVEALVEGKQGTLKQLRAALEKYGVTEVYPEGEPFDPEFHEALTIQPSATAEPNTVLTVVQRGYRIKDRLLRPARVIVSKEPD